jgi:hypothetical protein
MTIEKQQSTECGDPAAWKDKIYGNLHHQDFGNSIPLYTSPPASKPWVGLTNNELQPICDEYRILFGSWVEDFARAIEAKLKEKNDF